jgi:hypothetical protein
MLGAVTHNCVIIQFAGASPLGANGFSATDIVSA